MKRHVAPRNINPTFPRTIVFHQILRNTRPVHRAGLVWGKRNVEMDIESHLTAINLSRAVRTPISHLEMWCLSGPNPVSTQFSPVRFIAYIWSFEWSWASWLPLLPLNCVLGLSYISCKKLFPIVLARHNFWQRNEYALTWNQAELLMDEIKIVSSQ